MELPPIEYRFGGIVVPGESTASQPIWIRQAHPTPFGWGVLFEGVKVGIAE